MGFSADKSEEHSLQKVCDYSKICVSLKDSMYCSKRVMSDYNDNTEQRRLTALIYLITDDRP